MKYTPEVVAAARVLIDAEHIFIVDEGPLRMPGDLIAAARKTVPRGPVPDDLMALWNSKRDKRLPGCMKLTARRRSAAAARLKEFPRQRDWENFIDYINTSAWTLGETRNELHPAWKANFDWFVKPGSMVKFLEGQYTATNKPASTREEYGAELDRRNEMRGGIK